MTEQAQGQGPVVCPVCGRSAAWGGNPSRPFCSERCRALDLGNWASGHYRIPVEDQAVPSERENEKKGEDEVEK